MKRSTGGLVLLERTSVKDGSLFLRLLTQSSICRFSSSILSRLLDVSNGLGSSSSWMANKSVGSNQVVTAQHYVKLISCFYHHDIHIHKSALSCSTRNSYFVLTVGDTVGRDEVIFIILKEVTQTRWLYPARQFIVSKYPVIKKHNPDLPVLIREANGTPARVFARFGACTLAVASYSPYVLN